MSAVEAHIDDDAVNDTRWVEVVAALSGSSLHTMSQTLYNEARAADEAGEPAMEALYAVLGAVCGYYYKGEDRLEPYGPMVVLQTGRSAMPTDLRESDLDALAGMVSAVPVPCVRARVADALWIRRRDHQAAKTAVHSYVEAVEDRGEHWEHDALDQLERAMQIVSMLGKGGVDLRSVPVDAALRLLAEEPPLTTGYQRRLVRMLVPMGVTDALLPTLDQAVTRADLVRAEGDQDALRGLLELAALVLETLGQADNARECHVEIAESWVVDATAATTRDNPSHMQAVALMEFAIKEYRSIGGCQARVDELHRTMLEWQSRIGDEMQLFSTEIDLADVVQQSVDRVAGRRLPQAMVGLALVHGFRDIEEMRREAEHLMEEHPLQYLISRSQLDEKGRVVARPESMTGGDDSRKAAVEAEIYSQFLTTTGIVVHGGIEPARRTIVLEHAVRLEELVDLIGPSPFIPPGHERNYVKGLWFGLYGDYATAAQVLAPEVENALRECMVHAGAILPRLNSDATQAERMLGEVLYHEKAEAVFGANRLFTLKALLVSLFGANLRNRIAHGLMSDGELMSSATAYLWWLALRLAVEPMIHVENGPNDAAPTDVVEGEVDQTHHEAADSPASAEGGSGAALGDDTLAAS